MADVQNTHPKLLVFAFGAASGELAGGETFQNNISEQVANRLKNQQMIPNVNLEVKILPVASPQEVQAIIRDTLQTVKPDMVMATGEATIKSATGGEAVFNNKPFMFLTQGASNTYSPNPDGSHQTRLNPRQPLGLRRSANFDINNLSSQSPSNGIFETHSDTTGIGKNLCNLAQYEVIGYQQAQHREGHEVVAFPFTHMRPYDLSYVEAIENLLPEVRAKIESNPNRNEPARAEQYLGYYTGKLAEMANTGTTFLNSKREQVEHTRLSAQPILSADSQTSMPAKVETDPSQEKISRMGALLSQNKQNKAEPEIITAFEKFAAAMGANITIDGQLNDQEYMSVVSKLYNVHNSEAGRTAFAVLETEMQKLPIVSKPNKLGHSSR